MSTIIETAEHRIVTQPADDDALERVRSLLEKHRGASQAISSRLIAERCGISRRKVRAIIQHLVVTEGLLIGGLVSGQKTHEKRQPLDKRETQRIHGLEDLARLQKEARKRIGGGYFMIETWEDLAAVRMILSSRLAEIATRDRALVKAWTREHGQVVQPLLPWDELQVVCQV